MRWKTTCYHTAAARVQRCYLGRLRHSGQRNGQQGTDFLYPITPSLPPGLYIRSFEPPSVGAIAVFSVPEAARRYKALTGEGVREEFLFMKPIIAGPGDHVCSRPEDGIHVNGIRIAPITMHDRTGRSLPQWRGCRKLLDHEIFALSTYVLNSFDSRHVGPINLSEVVGVYRLLLGRMPGNMHKVSDFAHRI